MTGTTILHYRIGDKLGEGGMGAVYRAEDTRLGRQVAVKFLPAGSRDDPERRRRLFLEARAASVLRSPHTAVTYDIVEDAGALFIVMELVEGQLLSKKLEGGALQPAEVLDIAAQTADALDEAHAHGIIHRDIKSANIIITPRGLVKVLDFGIAKVLRPTGMLEATQETTATFAAMTRPGIVLGTVSYMSPEQALGRPIDHRSDLFALGVLTYEMATGALPFRGKSVMEIIDQILHHEPPPAAAVNPRVPAELSLLIQRAMQKEVAYRWPSAREFHERLRAILRRCCEPPPDAELTTSTVDIAGVPSEAREMMMAPRRTSEAIAVINFFNITREAADDWIGLGIAETVSTDLQSVHGLSIVGRARIFESLKDLSSSELNVLDENAAIAVGRRLGARWIVGGAFQRVGPGIRITAHVVDVRTGSVARTVKVDGLLANIFDLQDRIVHELAQGLSATRKQAEAGAVERSGTGSVDAYECFSRGMLNLRSISRESLDRALHFFERALEHDPEYAAAWAGLGAGHTLKGALLGFPELFDKAVRFLRRAIELRPTLATAHSWLGSALVSLGHIEEAMAEAKEAVRLDPQDAAAHMTLGRAYWIGKGLIPEGIAEIEKAVALNPEASHAVIQLGLLYALEQDFERAEAAARRAVELQHRSIAGGENGRIVGAHARLGYIFYLQGRLDGALREYERELAFLASSDHALRERTQIEVEEKLGAVHLRLGARAEGLRHLERAVKAYDGRLARGADDPFTKYYVAAAHALLGDGPKALRLLEESARQLPALMARRLKNDRDFDALRGDPGFAALLEKGVPA